MSIKDIRIQAQSYGLIGTMLTISWFLSKHFSRSLSTTFLGATEQGETLFALFSIVIVFALGFLIYELAKPTLLPSFVLAIFFGIVTGDLLSFITNSPESLTTLIVIGAVLILFEGGLETPFNKFRSLLAPILSIAFIGTLINAFCFSYVLLLLAKWLEIEVPIAGAIVLGAAIASTDPAAIIPSFQSLVFKRAKVKHIAISESAINDVIGAVLVGIFITFFFEGALPRSVPQAYALLLQTDNVLRILQTVIIGVGVGVLGYIGLSLWNNWKAKVQTEAGSDAALFLAVPLFCYLLASVMHGSGFLAVFFCGLLFHIRSHCRHVEHYFNHTIEGFMKPMIFMLLGAMVNVESLITYANIGIIAGFIFMFILRPAIVFITLAPFHWSRQHLTWKELFFLCFVRETGVIPAVLLITIQIAGIPGSEIIMAIGLWVILLTLIIEPPLTPYLACSLGLANETSKMPQRTHSGPVAVLCSRGYSFPQRMQTVVEWADAHQVGNIALLHCPEEKYTNDFVTDVEHRANELFKSINKQRTQEGKKEIHFEFLCGPGLLQDNIETLVEGGDVSIIFVGAKMLDYRLEDVKRLETPFFFMG